MLKGKLMERFAMAYMGEISLMFGMQISRNRKEATLTISHAHYLESLLEGHGMAECSSLYITGQGPELLFSQPEKLLDIAGVQRYQAITESLMFLGKCTRYGIVYSVNQLASAMSKPFNVHMAAGKHLLRYLKGQIDLVIT